MKNKCLYCYEPINEVQSQDFHEKCCTAFFGSVTPPSIEYTIDQMAELAKNVVERSIAIPGVQAKLSMSLIKEVKENTNSRLTIVGALGGQYIFKPPSDHFQEMPENEHVTMRIAEAFGIQVVPSSLIRLKSGELSYIAKRIDRSENGEKIHMLDMFQITEANDKYKSSMEKIGKTLHNYSDNTLLDKILYFELAIFSFLVGNNDMHLKNFSMIEHPSGWILAPAYDLLNMTIANPEDKEELALTLTGKKKKLKKVNFEQLGRGMELTNKQIRSVFNRMNKYKPDAIRWINKSYLSKKTKEKYLDLFEVRYQQIEL